MESSQKLYKIAGRKFNDIKKIKNCYITSIYFYLRPILEHSRRNLFDFTSLTNKRKEFTEKSLVGFSCEQMYDVVSDVENYYKFVPWCKKSLTYGKRQGFLKADLVIGFPPLNESYTSNVTMVKPNFVRAECVDGKLFNYLLNYWKFSPGLKDIPQSCVIDFHVAFEFKSTFHSHISHIFFDQLVKQMAEAFFYEAKNRYGMPSIKSHTIIGRKV